MRPTSASRRNASRESEEVADGIVLDYDRTGRIVGMEITEARRHLSPALLEKAA